MKIGFISLGCNKNLCDTENMMGLLSEDGFELTPYPEEAEVIVVNTCGFIESAKQESIDTILEMAEYKERSCKLLVVAGCLAQRYPDEIRNDLPEVDVIIGTTAFPEIVEAVKKGLAGVVGCFDHIIHINSFIFKTNGVGLEDVPGLIVSKTATFNMV